MREIVQVEVGSQLMVAVVGLWRRYSETLGFMPQGGFDQGARAGNLFAELDDDGVAGYVMFRVPRDQRAAIVHMCVAEEKRGRGVARRLFEEMLLRCSDCTEIQLRCRRDFDASDLWPKLGFAAVGEVPAKADGKFLTIWRYQLNTPPLLRAIEQASASSAVPVVIDVNVFLDLDEQHTINEESLGLQADWLSEYVELRITEETYNEIHRNESAKERERQRARATRYPSVERAMDREAQVLDNVRALLPPSSNPSAKSDIRQVVQTVAADIPFLVSRDKDLLNAADALYDEFGLRIMQPHEVVLHFDELRRETEYRPIRLPIGPTAKILPPRGDDLEPLVDLGHRGQNDFEPRKETKGRIRAMLAAPDRFEGSCVLDGERLTVAYFLDRTEDEVLSVPFFGVAPGPMASTAARHYIERIIQTAVRENRFVIRFARAGKRVDDALADAGFSWESNAWFRIALRVAATLDELLGVLGTLASEHPEVAEIMSRAQRLAKASTDPLQRAWRLEKMMWPLKVREAGIPCFVVPIQPRWATELFDQSLAETTLFGANPKLAMKAENAYYRAPRPGQPCAPARILWYVSGDKAFPGTQAIRASSCVDDVMIGSPNVVFRRFRRLGVYQWSDVKSIADNSKTNEVMGFQFSGTEAFEVPIHFADLQHDLLNSGAKQSQFQSPLRVKEEFFLEVYHRGTGR